MSTSRGSGAGVQPIPAGSRKMVQSLKEIVNCSEAEIYAALKECSMDPNEAVNRLLSQDPFHEVKSKREKKKEGKDATDSRSRGANKNSTRANKVGTDQYDSTSFPGKASYKKEYGPNPHSGSSSSVPGMSGNIRSRGSAGLSNGAPAETKSSLLGLADAEPSGGIQPTSGYQSAWMSAPGELSMADMVKMGRLHNKASNAPSAFHHSVQAPLTNESDQNLRFPEDHAAKVHESAISSVQHVPTNEEWPTIENPTTTKVISIPEYAMHSEQHPKTSAVLSDRFKEHSEEGEVHDTEDERFKNSGTNDLGSNLESGRKVLKEDSEGAYVFDNDLYKNMGSSQHQSPKCHSDEDGGASVSSDTRNLQQLSVEEEYSELRYSECVPSVVIPGHLQVHNVDCSQLSFGSFRPSMSAAYSSGTTASISVKPDFEQPHAEADTSSVRHPETRSSEYFVDDSHRNDSDGGLYLRAGASAGSYDTAASKPEDLQPENAEVPHGNGYHFPSSNRGYPFDDAQQLNAAFTQPNSQMQNLIPFSNVMPSYTNPLPSTLLPANGAPSRESDLPYFPFPVIQSMSAKYGDPVSSNGASAISISEALETARSSSEQSAPHSLSATNVATGPPLPQHLAVHPYSQHTLPLGPFANMIGYPFLPQSYAYMPSAFQQTFAGNNSYHQSLAALLPQYKSNISATALPQSAGYGAFGNTSTIPGNFPMNPPTALSQTTLNYDNVLSSQNKDTSHVMALQQGENPAMWLHGPNSRTMSPVPASSYYNYQGQNQQSSGLRQGQQPAQNYGAPGYPNLYHSQTTIPLDDQQNSRDGLLGAASHGPPKQSQIWQNSY